MQKISMLAASMLMLTGAIHAKEPTNASWNLSQGGKWNFSSNWSPAVVPTGKATFPNVIIDNSTITLKCSADIRQIEIDSDYTYKFDSDWKAFFTFKPADGPDSIELKKGKSIFHVDFKLENTLELNPNAGTVLEMRNNVWGEAGYFMVGEGLVRLCGEIRTANFVLGSGTTQICSGQTFGDTPMLFSGGKLLISGFSKITGDLFISLGESFIEVEEGTAAMFTGLIQNDGYFIKSGKGYLIYKTSRNIGTGKLVLKEGTTVAEVTDALGYDAIILEGGILALADKVSLANNICVTDGEQNIEVLYDGAALLSGRISGMGTLRLSKGTLDVTSSTLDVNRILVDGPAATLNAGAMYSAGAVGQLTLRSAGTVRFAEILSFDQDLEFENLGRVIADADVVTTTSRLKGHGIYTKDGEGTHALLSGAPAALRIDIVKGTIFSFAELLESNVALMGGTLNLSGFVYPAMIMGNGTFITENEIQLIGNGVTLPAGTYRVIDSLFYPVIYQTCD